MPGKKKCLEDKKYKNKKKDMYRGQGKPAGRTRNQAIVSCGPFLAFGLIWNAKLYFRLIANLTFGMINSKGKKTFRKGCRKHFGGVESNSLKI